MVQNFAEFQTHCREGSHTNDWVPGLRAPRQEKACCFCARVDWLENRHRVYLFKHLDGKVFECAVAKGKFGLSITSMVLHNGSAGSAASSSAVAGKLDCVATDELALAQAVDSGKEFTLQGLKLRVYKSIVYGAANDDDSDGTSDEDA